MAVVCRSLTAHVSCRVRPETLWFIMNDPLIELLLPNHKKEMKTAYVPENFDSGEIPDEADADDKKSAVSEIK